MSRKTPSPSEDDNSLFRQAVRGVRPLVQDKIHVTPKAGKQKLVKAYTKRLEREAGFYFSDEFEPCFKSERPLYHVRDGEPHGLHKQLRRGDFIPDLILDLHGMTRQQAKEELAALLAEARRQHIDCVCVIHGVSGGVLRRKVPAWLVQHPWVRAFHQAPLEWGGQGALLVLLELP